MSGPSAPEAIAHKEREVELHRALADGYRLRYGTPFAAIFQQAWNRALLDLLPRPIPSPALDDGCGTGILLPDLIARCDRVTGLDLSPEMLAQAGRRAPGVELRRGDLESLPFADGAFATVICRGSLHHVPSRERALAEAWRVLRPGGLLALSEPSDDFLPVRWARAAMYRRSPRFDVHDRAFRSRELAALLKEAGFEPLTLRRFGFAAYMLCGFPDVLPIILHLPAKVWITRRLVSLDAVLARVPLVRVASFHIMALARKPAAER